MNKGKGHAWTRVKSIHAKSEVCGANPHYSELRSVGSEEPLVIISACICNRCMSQVDLTLLL